MLYFQIKDDLQSNIHYSVLNTFGGNNKYILLKACIYDHLNDLSFLRLKKLFNEVNSLKGSFILE